MPFQYVNRLGRVYYLHVTLARSGTGAVQPRYFFSQHAERALERLPVGFVLGGEAPITGVPMLRKARERATTPVRRSA